MAHGSTRLHFPIREAAKDKQLDCRIPHIPSISIIHTICSICVDTTWHHNKTLRLKYLFIRLQERDITSMGLMTQHTEHTSNKHMRKLKMYEYRHLQMKKAEKPDYPLDPAECTRS